MSDKPHEMAVRSPWTDGAWIMIYATVPDGWEPRTHLAFGWRDLDFTDARTYRSIVEARPTAAS